MDIDKSAEAFTAALEQAVWDRGEDYVYPRRGDRCLYVYGGKPDCLIAQVLVNNGHTVDELEKFQQEGYDGEVYSLDSAETILSKLGYPGNVAWAADAAQSEQDQGRTWGFAEASYKQVLAEY